MMKQILSIVTKMVMRIKIGL